MKPVRFGAERIYLDIYNEQYNKKDTANRVFTYLLKKAGKRPEGLSFDPIFRGNLTALARGASVGAARIIPEIFRRYVFTVHSLKLK